MLRACRILALCVVPLVAAAAGANEPAADPPITPAGAKTMEGHKISVLAQGAVGAASVVAAVIGTGLLVTAKREYDTNANNSVANANSGMTSCRPCSTSDLAPIRALQYSGIALLGLGGGLLIADIALVIIDARYRGERRARALSRANGPLSLSVRF
jgi:hypothetical protein